MSKQPEALRLASALRDGTYLLSQERMATARELERQDAMIRTLRVGLEACVAILKDENTFPETTKLISNLLSEAEPQS